jgi:anti-anti-sigma factor
MQVTAIPGPVTVLAVAGRIDAETFSALIQEAERRLAAGETRFVLDLGQVDYISSGGLVALQTIAGRSASAGGKTVLCGIQSQVRKVLELTGFHRFFGIYTDRAAALAAFDQGS